MRGMRATNERVRFIYEVWSFIVFDGKAEMRRGLYGWTTIFRRFLFYGVTLVVFRPLHEEDMSESKLTAPNFHSDIITR